MEIEMDLDKMRETWRPKLGHDARWLIIGSIVGAFLLAVFKPESAATGVTLVGMVFAYVTGLFGIRQIGKNNDARVIQNATTGDK